MARASVISPEAELPIQAPVEEPIINSPFTEPKCHWAYDKSGKANKIPGRRSARYFWTTQRVMTGQTELDSIGGDYGSELLPLVNALRDDVSRWRASGYENATQIVEQLTDAIEPDDSVGEPPLLPVINRFRPYGSTAEVRFTTTRPCHVTFKSHIDQVVLDTETWERSVAFQLEASEVVVCFARNDHLGIEIPYEFYGGAHKFLPDFVVRMKSGVRLLLEVKGLHGEKEEAKFQAAKRWVAAVNNWGRMGRWAFHVCRSPDMLKTEIEYLNSQPIA
jgi:hypothetical protein